jgi:hypothetical protein
MVKHLEIKKAWTDEKLKVYDEKYDQEIAILLYAIRYGEDAALKKIYDHKEKKRIASLPKQTNAEVVGDVMHTTEPESINAEPEISGKKLKPVQHKGNYIGGKKAIRDTIFNKSRESKSLQNSTTLLIYLIQHSAWEGKNDKHDTYENWYLEKRKIVASRSQEQMAADLGVSVRTIQRWLDELERDKLIERDIEGRENVYILGKVKGDKEFFFYERK